MLEAKKSKIFETLFALYNRNLLKRRFCSFHICGLPFLLNKNSNTPVVIYCNHSSWWDGLIAFQISHAARLNSFVMMEEKQLRKLFLFRRLGAFSVVREKPREALKSVNYAVDLLKKNNSPTLWIFPQGEILPNDVRPIKFFSGLTKIIEKTEYCRAASLAMRYEFLGEFKPRIFVRVGEPELISPKREFDKKALTDKFSENLTANLDKLRNDIIENNLSEYVKIF